MLQAQQDKSAGRSQWFCGITLSINTGIFATLIWRWNIDHHRNRPDHWKRLCLGVAYTNSYIHRIGQITSPVCPVGHVVKKPHHVLRCWSSHAHEVESLRVRVCARNHELTITLVSQACNSLHGTINTYGRRSCLCAFSDHKCAVTLLAICVSDYASAGGGAWWHVMWKTIWHVLAQGTSSGTTCPTCLKSTEFFVFFSFPFFLSSCS